MSISAMKQALEFIETQNEGSSFWMVPGSNLNTMVNALRQAISEAEKQEPVAFHVHKSAIEENDFKEHVNFYTGPAPSGDFVTLYTAPVHASDISQERVDETAKSKHEPVAWHEPGAYGNVTTHKDWALANGWLPLYKERT